MSDAVIKIVEATSPEDIADVKKLFQEYADFLQVDLCFQGFDEEMATFPDFYSLLLIAKVNDKPAAAIGLKDLGNGACEMKRLYARPQFQKLGIGRRLSERLITEAQQMGFRLMRLDTLQRLETAVSLYRKLGFVETDKYYDNPEENVIYMERSLTKTDTDTGKT